MKNSVIFGTKSSIFCTNSVILGKSSCLAQHVLIPPTGWLQKKSRTPTHRTSGNALTYRLYKSTDTPHHFIRKILVTFVGENLAFYWDFWWVKTWSRSTQLCNKRKFKRLFCDFTDFWSGFRLEEGVWVPVQNQYFCFLLKFWRCWLTQKSPEMSVSERAKSQLS